MAASVRRIRRRSPCGQCECLAQLQLNRIARLDISVVRVGHGPKLGRILAHDDELLGREPVLKRVTVHDVLTGSRPRPCTSLRISAVGLEYAFARSGDPHEFRVPCDFPQYLPRKGDRSNLCAAPVGPFRQNGPIPFPPPVFRVTLAGNMHHVSAVCANCLPEISRFSRIVMQTWDMLPSEGMKTRSRQEAVGREIRRLSAG